MKSLLTCSLLFIISIVVCFLPSCTKETITTIIKTDTVTIIKTDTLRTVFNDTSRIGLFTRKQWIIDTAISNYSGPGTGTLLYVRGSKNNIYNYDLVRSIFWAGGNEDFFSTDGAAYSYKWSLSGSDSTALVISNSNSTAYRAKIMKLDATHLVVFDSTNQTLDIQIFKP